MKIILSIIFCLAYTVSFAQRPQNYSAQLRTDTAFVTRQKTDVLVLKAKAPWNQGTGGRYDGDSYTAGQNSTTPDSDFVNRTALYYGLYSTKVNAGVGGTGVWSAASLNLANVNTTSPTTNTLYESMMSGLNDLRRAGNNAALYRKIVNCYKSVWANMYLKNWQTANAGANVIRYGAWTAYNSPAVGGKAGSFAGSFTSTVNDSLVYSFTDSTVVWGGIGSDGTTNVYSNAISVYIDNVLVDTYSENLQYDGISDGVYDNKRGPVVRVYGGLTLAAHKLKIVNGQAAPMVVDYVGNLMDAASTSAKPFYVWKVPYMPASGYTGIPSSGSIAVTDSVNVKIDSLFSALPVYPVAVINTNYYTNTVSDMDADSIHRNNQGHRRMAEGMEATVPDYSFSKYPGTINYFGGRFYMNDAVGSRQKMAFLSDISGVTAPGSNGNILFNSSSSLGTDSRFNWDATNHRLGIGPTAPAYDLDINGTFNGGINAIITNSSTGNGAFSQIGQFNDVGDFTRFAQYCSGNLGSGMVAAHDGSLDQSGGNLSIRVNTGKVIKFGINNVEFARINATGFGWGRAATTDMDVYSANAATEIRSTTSNASASSLASFSAFNSSGHALQMGIFSAATSSGIFGAEEVFIQGNNAGNLTILTNTAKSIKIAPNGTVRATFNSAGNALLNTATDNNSFLNIGAGTTALSQINLPAGTAKTTPVAGDLFYDGTHLYFKPSGTIVDLLAGGGMTNPLTTTGDIIYSSSGTTPARLGIGATGATLTVTGGVPAWGPVLANGTFTPVTTALSNVSASSITLATYSRTGNTVVVTVTGTVTPSANTTLTSLQIDLPLTSSTGTTIPIGAASVISTTAISAGTYYKISTTSGTLKFYSTSTSSCDFTINYAYTL